MTSQTFFVSKPSARLVQPNPHPCVKVVLSADACMISKLNQCEKAEQFREDLDDAWQSLDKVTKTLASKHHKSLWHVQNDLYLGHMKFCSRKSKINAWNAFSWKKQCTLNELNRNAAGSTRMLLDLVQQNCLEYHELSAEDKDHLVEEFSQFKESKAVGIRATTKSKINDITHMLKAIENEGVADFLGSVMGIDTQDLISKMEGFAIQGIKGAAENHQQHILNVHAALCNIINCQLHEFFHTFTGWLDTVIFANLSSASSSLLQLEVLLWKWEMGSIHWKKLSDDKFRELQQARNEQLESGEIQAHSRRTHSDKGKKHTPYSLNAPSNKKYKSAAIINDDNEENADLGKNAQSSSSGQPAHTQMRPINNPTPAGRMTMVTNASSAMQTNTSGFDANSIVSSTVAEQQATEQQATEQQATEWQALLNQLAEDVLTFDASMATLY
ncbi:hypothetical protein EDD16DRAFT_1521187 [Pisolithus croceorrhizus]|nr:hypothetical protein EDD16DRAFT_1521187 [Pisolithus croceorrhizus]KAI6134323.1 hypothetical protein EV401DRAFT_1882846 [Pisolithus croceorrhizus]